MTPDNRIFVGEGWDTASISKLDGQGNVVWKKDYGLESHPILASNEYILAVVLSTYSTCKVIICDLDGNEINSWDIQMDVCYDTILNGNDLYILGDNPGGILGNVHSTIIKSDLNGNIPWTDTLIDVHGLRAAIDKNNDLYVSGYSFGGNQTWYRTVKYDLSGNRIWERLYSGDINSSYNLSNHVYSLIAHPNGGCLVAGTLVKIGKNDPNSLDGGAISYDPDGNVYFAIRYDANPGWYRTTFQASLFCHDNCLALFGSTIEILDLTKKQFLFLTKCDNVIGVYDNEYTTPDNFSLLQNYPNPFNPVTKTKYSVPSVTLRQAQSDIKVTLKIYYALGREVATLVNEEKPAGEYEVGFEGSTLSSGIYFYQLKAGDYRETRKMVLLL